MSTVDPSRYPAVGPIIVRAAITADEWATLRKLAIDRRTPAAELVADALRAAYPLTEGTK